MVRGNVFFPRNFWIRKSHITVRRHFFLDKKVTYESHTWRYGTVTPPSVGSREKNHAFWQKFCASFFKYSNIDAKRGKVPNIWKLGYNFFLAPFKCTFLRMTTWLLKSNNASGNGVLDIGCQLHCCILTAGLVISRVHLNLSRQTLQRPTSSNLDNRLKN